MALGRTYTKKCSDIPLLTERKKLTNQWFLHTTDKYYGNLLILIPYSGNFFPCLQLDANNYVCIFTHKKQKLSIHNLASFIVRLLAKCVNLSHLTQQRAVMKILRSKILKVLIIYLLYWISQQFNDRISSVSHFAVTEKTAAFGVSFPAS